MQLNIMALPGISYIGSHDQIALCAIAYLSSYAPACHIVVFDGDGLVCAAA